MEIDEQLDPLAKTARVAVACCCVEHVADLYKKGNVHFRVGAAAGTLKADPAADVFDAALELAWAFAESGTEPDPAAVAAVNTGTSNLPDGMDRTQAALPALEVLDALESTFAAIKDPTPHAATNVLETCINALHDMVDGVAAEGSGEQASEQERAWQERVIERAKQVGKSPLSRASFDDLIAQQLPWRQHLKAYEDSF
jgi:hypothetical protein